MAAVMGPMAYTRLVLASCMQLDDAIEEKNLLLDGYTMIISDVVAVSQHGVDVSVTDDKKALQIMQASVDLLDDQLAQGKIVYGVNSGFGGNADTRTNVHDLLQKALIQHHNTAVLIPSDMGRRGSYTLNNLRPHHVPLPVVKAAMVTRCNSLLRGHSAVRIELVRNLASLISQDFIPVVPLRGSISASGDLTPLAYIAGTLEGNPDIFVHCGQARNDEIVTADRALRMAGLEPLSFRAKEALGVLNGTAFSTGAASLVLFEANQLVLLSQVLTAMGTEALLGTRRNFHPFISDVRPHQGQKEVAENIYRFLADSRLTHEHQESLSASASAGVLAQDRYPLRTAPQWLGPQIESMSLAYSQVVCELNSSTDNPLFHAPLTGEAGTVHHGGNFQACSITSAMEKTTSAMQSIGKLIFTQCSEILNPMLSKGLPPNLCADDPSLSFALKGIDINMASYMSELAYLNNPVTNFVQTADVNNQPVNSLALIGARYAADAVEVLSLMLASQIYVLCQAVDLRVLHIEFENVAKTRLYEITLSLLSETLQQQTMSQAQITDFIWSDLLRHWNRHSMLDLAQRATEAVDLTVGALLELTAASTTGPNEVPLILTLREWQKRTVAMLIEEYHAARTAFFENPTTRGYLCTASLKIYQYVRDVLGVPMHRGLDDHPTYPSVQEGRDNGKKTIGSHIGTIYAALRDGKFRGVLLECFAEVSHGVPGSESS